MTFHGQLCRIPLKNKSRLLLYGLVRELNLEIDELPELRNWLIYSFDDEVICEDQINIRSLKKEYLEKVPVKEALRFKSLLVVGNETLSAEKLIALIKKCEIQKVALLQSRLSISLVGAEPPSKHTQIESIHDELVSGLTKDEASGCEVKRFLSCAEGHSDQSIAVDFRSNVENCFLWLCE